MTDSSQTPPMPPPQNNMQSDALAAAVAAATAAASAANAAASAAASAASAANTIISVVGGVPPQNFSAAPPPLAAPAGQNGQSRRNVHNYNPGQSQGGPNGNAQVYHSYQAPNGGFGAMAALPAPFLSEADASAQNGPYGQWKGQSLDRGRFHAAAWDDEETGMLAEGAVPLRMEMTPPPFFHLYASLEQTFARLSGYAKGSLFVGVTSAILGEGKTTVALHLALSAARATQKRVCLIDLSLGEDDLCRRMGAAPAPGGTVSLLEEKGVLGVMEINSPGNLFFIPAGKVPDNPAQMARSKDMSELFTTLRGEYDLIIADMPAVVTDNAVPLAALMDGVVLVMQAGATPRTMATEAIEKLGRDRVAGVVLNRIGASSLGQSLPTTRRDEAASHRGGRN